MIQNLPIDIICMYVEPFLKIKDIINIILLCKKMNIPKRWKNLKMINTDSLCLNTCVLFNRIKNSCLYCNSVFNSKKDLYEHIMLFNHKKKFIYNYNIKFNLFDTKSCMQGNCDCLSKNVNINRIRNPIIIKTLYGSLKITSIVFWTSVLDSYGNYYIQQSNKLDSLRIYILNKHHWLVKNNIAIPIIGIESI